MKIAIRFLFLIVVLIFCFAGETYRILDIALFKREYYQRFINLARATTNKKFAVRGRILDRNGKILAITTKKIDIGVDPYVAETLSAEKATQLASLLKIDEESIRKAFTRESYIKNGIEHHRRWKCFANVEDNEIYEQVKALSIKGVYGVLHWERIYPNHTLASHVIGFVNKEGIAVCGIERFMDRFLMGQDGWVESEKDGKREELALFRKIVVEPKNGADVVLTLDIHLQDMVEEILSETVKKNCAKSGTIIVSDAQTGEILTLCNIPTFDCNDYNKAEISSLRNRAVTDLYEPGSVFKIVAFSEALQQGVISLQQYFDCQEAEFFHGGKVYLLPRDHTFLGRLSASDVLRKSSNRGIAQIAILLGADRLYNAARAFGFGEKTGYGFDGEGVGVLPNPSNWDNLTITRLPMGHSVSATPIQVHQAMGVLGNGGFLVKPKIIDRVIDVNGENLWESESRFVRRVLAEETVDTVRKILHRPDLVLSHIGSIKLAYKTGTSQKIIDKRYSQDHHISSCSGFFPADDPCYLVTVVIDDAEIKSGVAYGSKIALPVFYEIAKILLQRSMSK
ncbi:MAG: penicillin-binding protein 2 [Puniceicoccales bacterium]|jgi:cell division protein FtsI/penicillin-binding protein 2|nr:penicillin-binding protein 2 [Puniceicoccales bacterium]